MSSLLLDIRFAFRMLAKSPVFTIAAVICLGLGIGANASILPFLNGIVLNPLTFEDPDELVYMYESAPERGYTRISVAYPDFVDWREQNRVFSGIAAFSWDSRTLINQGDPVRLDGVEITYDLPAILGKEPILGRGFGPDNMLTVYVEEDFEEDQRVSLFYRELQERINALPGVLDASLTTALPAGYVGWSRGLYVEGTEPPPPGQGEFFTHAVISPGYFSSFRIPMVRGREFNEQDAIEGSQPVIIINAAFAEKYWPDGDPIGKRISYGSQPDPEAEWMEVVGVAANTYNSGYTNPVRPGIYRPHSQYVLTSMNLVLRSSSDPLDLVDNVRAEIWAIDPNLPLDNIQTMKQIIMQQDWDQYLFTYMFSVFSLIALLLASIGVYGVVSYSVAQRSREFGIRMALGAGPGKVVRLVVRQGVILSFFGLSAGIIIALLVMKFVSSVLFGVNPTDMAVYTIATISMGIVVLTASYLPARRATNVDPVDALRIE